MYLKCPMSSMMFMQIVSATAQQPVPLPTDVDSSSNATRPLEAYTSNTQEGQKQIRLFQPGGSLHLDARTAVPVPNNPVIATGPNLYSEEGIVRPI